MPLGTQARWPKRSRVCRHEDMPGNRELQIVTMVGGTVVELSVNPHRSANGAGPVQLTLGLGLSLCFVASVEHDAPRRNLDFEISPTVSIRVEHQSDAVLLPQRLVVFEMRGEQARVVNPNSKVQIALVPEQFRACPN